MFTCIFCLTPNLSPHSREHILPDFMGGKVISSDIICANCNNRLSKSEAEFAKDLEPFRLACDFRNSRGDNPPPTSAYSEDGAEFKLDASGSLYPKTDFKKVRKGEAPNSFSVTTYDEAEFRKIVRQLIKAKTDLKGEAIDREVERCWEEATKQEIDPPEVQMPTSIGSDPHAQAMCAALFELLAYANDNCALTGREFDELRSFILSGSNRLKFQFKPIDTRSVAFVGDFSESPNLLWVSQTLEGEVLGHFRIYGTIGFNFSMGLAPALNLTQAALVSDPTKPANYSLFVGKDVPWDSKWLIEASSEVDKNNDETVFDSLRRRQFSKEVERRAEAQFSNLLLDMGVEEDTSLTDEQVKELQARVLKIVPEIFFPRQLRKTFKNFRE